MTSSPTSQPILSSSFAQHTFRSVSSRIPEPHPNAPTVTALVFAESHSYRSLVLLRMLGGEQKQFQQAALFTTEIEELALCDFILLDTTDMTLNEAQESVVRIRSATLAPLAALVVGDFTREETLLRAGADAAISINKPLEVSLAFCKATIRRTQRSCNQPADLLER